MHRVILACSVIFPVAVASGCVSVSFERQQEIATDINYGRALYVERCAACHGAGGAGDGVVARVMTEAVPDLTRLSAERGGEYPVDYVYRVIDGRQHIAAHGDRKMPVWGTEFWLEEGADERAEVRVGEKIHALISYLQTL